MDEVSGTQNLINRGGIWYYNRRVPKHLTDKIGAKLIRISLKTSDKAEAKKLRSIRDVEWDARFESYETSAPPIELPAASTAYLSQLVRDYVERKYHGFEERALGDVPSNEGRGDLLKEADQALATLNDPSNPELDAWVTNAADEIQSRANVSVSESPQQYSRLIALVVRGLAEFTRRKIDFYSGDFSKPFHDQMFDPNHPPEVTFGELAKQYLAQQIEEAHANGLSTRWTDKLKATVEAVRMYIGDGTKIIAIDYDVCQTFRTQLARTPANRTKLYGQMPLAKAIERAAKEGKRTLSSTTQRDYLSAFRNIMELGAQKKLIGHNPAANLQPLIKEKLAGADRRHPFSLDQIKKFFTSDFYKSCAPDAPKPYTRSNRTWRFWLPLICLYMGMRPNEVCQLHTGDVKQTKSGVWYFDVSPSGEDETALKTLKTSNSRRKIPVHPELIAIGFFSLLERRLKVAKSDPRLLPGLRSDKYGNAATYALKRFRDIYLPEAMELEARQSFYSFRHSFRDALRRCEAPPSALKALGAWSQGSLVSDDYGDKYDPDYQVKWIAKVAFPGLDLSYLYGTEKIEL